MRGSPGESGPRKAALAGNQAAFSRASRSRVGDAAMTGPRGSHNVVGATSLGEGDCWTWVGGSRAESSAWWLGLAATQAGLAPAPARERAQREPLRRLLVGAAHTDASRDLSPPQPRVQPGRLLPAPCPRHMPHVQGPAADQMQECKTPGYSSPRRWEALGAVAGGRGSGRCICKPSFCVRARCLICHTPLSPWEPWCHQDGRRWGGANEEDSEPQRGESGVGGGQQRV